MHYSCSTYRLARPNQPGLKPATKNRAAFPPGYLPAHDLTQLQHQHNTGRKYFAIPVKKPLDSQHMNCCNRYSCVFLLVLL
jgi:hypothetical protein